MATRQAQDDRFPREPLSADATVELLERARQGDQVALDTLIQRSVPALRRWARMRLPQSTRGTLETADLVLDAVVDAMRRLDGVEARHEGALHAYLRQAVIDRIRDVVSLERPRPALDDLPDRLTETSPLESAIGPENMARYDAALERLSDADRQIIISRIELQYSYGELTAALDQPTEAAVRMAVTRALRRLADELSRIEPR